MFSIDNQRRFIFIHGKTAYTEAKKQASQCLYFQLDKDEDEWVTTIQWASCYNCLFRRWTPTSFMCMKQDSHEK
ncbi:MAG: molybdopterin biosynthesis protein MoeB [Sulfurospirillaceae bacterium]|nr:molybdopterin biosynthesis protein MoeB [Sulfurospirillaceae bacterium]